MGGSTRRQIIRTAPLKAAAAASLLNTALILATTQTPWAVRLSHSLYDMGHNFAFAFVALLWAWSTAGLWRWLRDLTALALIIPFSALVLSRDLSIFIAKQMPSAPGLGLWLLLIGVSVAVLLIGHVAHRLAAGAVRGLFFVLGVALWIGNRFLLQADYPGVHALIAACAGILLWASLRGGRPWPMWSASPALLLALASFFIPPSQRIRAALMRMETSTLAPFVAPLWAAAPAEGDGGEEGGDAWPGPRAHPSAGRFFPEGAVVVLISVDALRGDLIERVPERLVNLKQLSTRGLYFTQARTPGSQTVYTLTALFTGTYFLQQRWDKVPSTPELDATRVVGHLFPLQDQTERFPTTLTRGGVKTVHLASTAWFINAVGVTRGFEEERFVRDPHRAYTHVKHMKAAIIERLQAHEGGDLFLFTHLLDTHAPYDRGGREGDAFERYLREIALVDEALGEINNALAEMPWASKAYLMITGDHGEAFGEHGAEFHGTHLYEEQVRVPLIIIGPGVPIQRSALPASTLDIGPTLLDAFGLETPAHHMGESLTPTLRGQEQTLKRPLFMETRLKRARVWPDGIKVIVDDRRGTTEVYDLKADPKEQENLADEPRYQPKINAMRRFIETYRLKEGGYEVPYRR
ncbi:sulfatase-like hydrolase/transferase [Myxococcota bacterium]|nr:sulfatase-like hydrolase/transferase [Myxococcota bacterium]MBU1432105.1 sulfatase-like hydrolase/transferase [Myxococcota bacterium]MBU1900684.1 sulfatase-like hydrolase/transferase [Myxococcota bacterium]